MDLNAVEFIDASGISVLLETAGAARERGGALVLRSPSRPVRRLLDLCRLDGRLPVESDSP